MKIHRSYYGIIGDLFRKILESLETLVNLQDDSE